MGMYNEVFDTCPQCGKHTGYMQIGQIVLGFGEFDIANLAELKRRFDRCDLSAQNLNNLADVLEKDGDNGFRCRDDDADDHDCYASWRADPAKILAIRMLAHVSVGDTRERALRLLEDAGILG